MLTQTRHLPSRQRPPRAARRGDRRRRRRRRSALGVAKHLSPYGANDPATQSVQATNRFQAAAGRQIDPGVVALVSAGDVHERRPRSGASSRSRRSCAAQPDVARVRQLLRHPRPRDGLPRRALDRTSSPTSSRCPTEQLKDDAQRIENRVRRPARRRARRAGDRERAGQHAGRQRPRARRAARVPVHLPALAAVLPLARRVAAAAAARRPRDPRDVLRAADRLELRRPVGVRAQPRHRPRARARDRLQPVHGLALPRGGGASGLRRRRRCAARCRPRAGRSCSAR